MPTPTTLSIGNTIGDFSGGGSPSILNAPAIKPASTNPKSNVAFKTTGTQAGDIAAGYIVNGVYNPNAQKQSTTTLSSNKNQDIANIRSTTDGLSKTGLKTDTTSGITTDAGGNAYTPIPTVTSTVNNPDGSSTATYSDGSQKTTSPTTGSTTTTGGYIGDVYYAPGSTLPKNADGTPVTLTDTSPANDSILKSLNDQIARNDAMTASLIANITQNYSQLIKLQEQSNAGVNAATNTFLLKSGSLQSTQSGRGTLQSQINYGIQQIADLNSKEQTAILQAQQAGMNNDFQLQDQINKNIQSTRQEKQNAAVKLNDSIVAANKDLADKQFQVRQATTTIINGILKDYADNGGNDPKTISAIQNSKNVGDAIAAAGDLQKMTGDFADYPQYKKDALANKQVPLSATDWLAKKNADAAKLKVNEAYGTAFATAKGKAVGEASALGNQTTITSPVTSSVGVTSGLTFNAPASIAPYVAFAANGVKYVDLSGFKGTPTEANQAVQDAQKAGYKVIVNKNTALDVQNITDAMGKLEDMRAAFNAVSPDSAAARDTWQAAWITAATALQTDPNAASNDVYVAAALDILKALSGVQGFRGGQSIVKSVENIFPSNTHTQAVNNQKINKLQEMIDTRQTALVGKPSASDQMLIDANNADKTVTDGLNKIKTTNPALYKAAAGMYLSNNPNTGHPYSAQDILQAFPELSQ